MVNIDLEIFLENLKILLINFRKSFSISLALVKAVK